MSEICIHDNVKECCNKCKSEQNWQLWDISTNRETRYYLKDLYTEKVRMIPKKYSPQINKLIQDKSKYHSKVCNCEMKLQEIIDKVLKRRKR